MPGRAVYLDGLLERTISPARAGVVLLSMAEMVEGTGRVAASGLAIRPLQGRAGRPTSGVMLINPSAWQVSFIAYHPSQLQTHLF
jgi:hypothetical protein